MKCLICGGESSGDVCNKCIRLEKIVYQKEWSYKEGLLLKKVEDLRIAISNLRISGRVSISDNPKGLNARIDNVSHYLLNVKECTQTEFQNKKTLMIVIENSQTGFTRYLFLPGFEFGDQLVDAIFDAKQKATSLTERIRQNNGSVVHDTIPTTNDSVYGVHSDMNIINMDEEETIIPSTPISAPSPVPVSIPEPQRVAEPIAPSTGTAEPVSYDTVALSSIAEDISEFETKIKKLKVLRDNGILSEEEYQAEKKKLVSIF
jgi:hypothetical protein